MRGEEKLEVVRRIYVWFPTRKEALEAAGVAA